MRDGVTGDPASSMRLVVVRCGGIIHGAFCLRFDKSLAGNGASKEDFAISEFSRFNAVSLTTRLYL